MLAKPYILNNKKVFTALKFKGEKFKTGVFLISYFANRSNAKNNRFGIIISAKAVAKASDRNLIKRKARAILFNVKDKTCHNNFLDLVIVVLTQPKTDDYEKLGEGLNKLFYEEN
jgi:ribonuclease P protein component